VNPEVARRWGRFVALKFARSLARILARRRVRKTVKTRERAIIGAQEAVLYAYRGAEKLKLNHSIAIYRVVLFLLTANRDLCVITEDILTSGNWWLRKLLARNVALLMYELDMSKVTGKEFRMALNYFAPPRQFSQRVESNLAALRAIHTQLRSEFEEIRQNTIAHRDADAIRQYRLIRNIDELTIVKRCSDFFSVAEPLVEQLVELTKTTGDMRHIVNQHIGRKLFKKKTHV